MNELEALGIENIKPAEIEARSFEIIGQELNMRKIIIPKEHESIVKRAIHTTADFEYADTLKFSRNAVDIIQELILDGADIVSDTNMALTGINKKVLAKFGGSAHCFMADEDVALEAKSRQITRAMVSMEKAMKLDKKVIFAIGNAPTALIALWDAYSRGVYNPSFIIGVPVGFVNVEASKELIINSDIPHIVNAGRKGGSNVAAAICNAVLYDLGR